MIPVSALAQLLGRPLLMEPRALRGLIAALQAGPSASAPWAAATARPSSTTPSGSLALIPIFGFLEYRPGWSTALGLGTSTAVASQQVVAARDSARVDVIGLLMDSPGGVVDGLPEFCYLLRETRRVKPVVAIVDTMAASAAYGIASQANLMIATTSTQTGSIGVWTAHFDSSRALDQAGITVTLVSAGKFKTEGNSFQPLSDAARSHIQGDVDRVYGQFVDDIVAGRQRGLTASAVRSGFGEGRMVDASEGLRRGLIDRVFPTTAGAFAFAAGAGERQMIQAARHSSDICALEFGTPSERRAAEARILAGGADARTSMSLAESDREAILAALGSDRSR